MALIEKTKDKIICKTSLILAFMVNKEYFVFFNADNQVKVK